MTPLPLKKNNKYSACPEKHQFFCIVAPSLSAGCNEILKKKVERKGGSKPDPFFLRSKDPDPKGHES